MKRILSLLMAAVTSLSLAACSAGTPEETPSTSQSVSADYSVDSTAAAAESQPTEEQSTAAADNAPSAEAAHSTTADTSASTPETAEGSQPEALPEDGTYSSRDDVALFIHTYGHLPGNFITKKEAEKLDALHDCLTDLSDPVHLTVLHAQALEDALGAYCRSFQRVLSDSAQENEHFTLTWEE